MVWLLLGFAIILCIPLVILYVPWVSPKARHSFIMAVRNLWLHKLRSFLLASEAELFVAEVIVVSSGWLGCFLPSVNCCAVRQIHGSDLCQSGP